MSADPERARIRREQIATYNRERELDSARRGGKTRLILFALSPLIYVPVYTLIQGPSVAVIVGYPLLMLAATGMLWCMVHLIEQRRRREP